MSQSRGGPDLVETGEAGAAVAVAVGAKRHVLAVGLVVLASFLAYGNALTTLVAYNDAYPDAGYTYDNKYIIQLDPRMQASSWADAPGRPGVVGLATRDYRWTKGVSGLYRPVISLSYWINWHVIGGDESRLDPALDAPAKQAAIAAIRHRRFLWLLAINVLSHTAVALLLYATALVLTARFWTSAAMAVLFSTHPIAVESVTNVVGRADLFAAIAVLGGLVLHVREVRSEGTRRGLLLGALMLVAVWGVFSKESAVMLAPVVVLYDLLYRTRLRELLDRIPRVMMDLGRIALRMLLLAALYFFWWRMALDRLLPWLNAMVSEGRALPDGTGAPGLYGALFVLWCLAFVSVHAVPIALALRAPWRAVAAALALPAVVAVWMIAGGAGADPWSWGFLGTACLLAWTEMRIQPSWLAAGARAGKTSRESSVTRAFPATRTSHRAPLAAPESEWRRLIDGYLVFIPVAIALFCIRGAVFGAATPSETPFLDNPIKGVGPLAARLSAFGVLARITKILVLPNRLSCDYSFDQVPPFGKFGSWLDDLICVLGVLGVLAALVVTAGLIWKGRARAGAFLVLFFLLTYLPTSHLLMTGTSVMAERFAYLPMAGFVGCLVLVVEWLARRVSPHPRAARVAACAVFGVVGALYGARTFARNLDWRSDIHLWSSARRSSPKSFRSHQSYAFALFDELQKPPGMRQPGMEALTIDQVIDPALSARAIIEPLPDRLNSARPYLQLALFYSFKGDQLASAGPDGARIPTPESRPAYLAALEVLEHAVPIDRSLNASSRARALARGRHPREIPDDGLPELYLGLGYCEMQLGRLDEALKAFRDMRHLAPSNPEPIVKIAVIHRARGEPEVAAVAFTEALLLGASRADVWSGLRQCFEQIDAESGSAVILGAQGPSLDMGKPVVRKVVLDAYESLIRVNLESKAFAEAERLRMMAVQQAGFPPGTFDGLFLGDGPPRATTPASGPNDGG